MFTLAGLTTDIQAHPDRWRPLVLTNGCFDLLHAGHVRYLQAARSLGKSLVIGLNSDTSVKLLKGEKRPIVPEAERAEVLLALRAVDAVVIFAEKTADQLIYRLLPDIYAKGGDYTPENLPEANAVQAIGGQIALMAIEVPSSTSQIIQRILHTYA